MPKYVPTHNAVRRVRTISSRDPGAQEYTHLGVIVRGFSEEQLVVFEGSLGPIFMPRYVPTYNTVRRVRTISSLDSREQEYTNIGVIVRTISSIYRFIWIYIYAKLITYIKNC